MEQLTFNYKTDQKIERSVHVGVVGSGDLEVIFEPVATGETQVNVITGSDGFSETWNNVLTRFFSRYPISAKVTVHDFGATPGVVYLRLTQALEGLGYEE